MAAPVVHIVDDMRFAHLLAQALSLSDNDRRLLVEELVDSLDPAPGDCPLTSEQQEEIRRRMEASRAGTSDLMPWDDFIAELRAR